MHVTIFLIFPFKLTPHVPRNFQFNPHNVLLCGNWVMNNFMSNSFTWKLDIGTLNSLLDSNLHFFIGLVSWCLICHPNHLSSFGVQPFFLNLITPLSHICYIHYIQILKSLIFFFSIFILSNFIKLYTKTGENSRQQCRQKLVEPKKIYAYILTIKCLYLLLVW